MESLVANVQLAASLGASPALALAAIQREVSAAVESAAHADSEDGARRKVDRVKQELAAPAPAPLLPAVDVPANSHSESTFDEPLTRCAAVLRISQLSELTAELPAGTTVAVHALVHGHTAESVVLVSETRNPPLDLALPLPSDAPPGPPLAATPSDGGLLAVSAWKPGARGPLLLGCAPIPWPALLDEAPHTIPVVDNETHQVQCRVTLALESTPTSTGRLPVSAAAPSPGLWTPTAVARWWQTHVQTHARRFGRPPACGAHVPPGIWVTDETGDRVPLPLLLARAVGPLPGIATAAAAARFVATLPLLSGGCDASAHRWQSPKFTLAVGAVAHDHDRAVLLAALLRGIRREALIVLGSSHEFGGASSGGGGCWVAVMDHDPATRRVVPGTVRVANLAAGALDARIPWRGPNEIPGWTVTAAVAWHGVYAHEGAGAVHGADIASWDVRASGAGWRALALDPATVALEATTGAVARVQGSGTSGFQHTVVEPLWRTRRVRPLPAVWVPSTAAAAEVALATALQAWVAEHRGFLDLDTAWDPVLCWAMHSALAAMDARAINASGATDFDLAAAVRASIPAGWLFRAAPLATPARLFPPGTAAATHVTETVRRAMGEWSRHAPAASMLREASAAAVWAGAVYVGGSGAARCLWVMVGVAVSEEDGDGDRTAAAGSSFMGDFDETSVDGSMLSFTT
ncbi:hypothetical protein H9P43_001712 [Blastocladiella emersonii ATCC 22665]|nr:hypothetical protein H9P43_001712 [Blastocladiella emersonii ATCC 22665]